MLLGSSALDFTRATIQEREAQRKAGLNLNFFAKKKEKKVK
ncbi:MULTISPECIES: hypothetical protein [Motilimonas]|nr:MULTISPECIES: hypothetical protein [Motilimonas]MDO6527683.1 hypothetical protein [Motilimonas sp. 1_MG-2023]